MQIQSVDQSGLYDVAPLELDAASALAPQALKIAKPDTNEYYYVSYRRGIGFDANLSPSLYLDRISIHRYPGDGSSSKTHLLALPVDGESFTDPVNGISVTQISHNTDYATVEVSLGGSDPTPVCTADAPQVSLAPASQSANAGSTVNYTVELTNRDSEACASSTFALSENVPTGWNGSLSATALQLAPGSTGTVTFSVTSTGTATPGSYTLPVGVSDTAEPVHDAAASATYLVNETTPPTDSESPTTPTGVAASANFKQVSLTWNPSSDNVGVAGYEVLRDGSLIGAATDSSYTDTSGTDGVIYEYSVRAFDAAGNRSPYSTPVMAGKSKAKAKGKAGDGGDNPNKGKGKLK
jgi:hypothetical protein